MLSPKYKFFKLVLFLLAAIMTQSQRGEDSNIISLNYWQWDGTFIKRRFYDSKDFIRYCHRWFCGFWIELSLSKYRKFLSHHL